MKLLRLFLLVVAGWALAAVAAEPAPVSVTSALTQAYDAAWDRGDVDAMYAMLAPDCIFRSPYQTRIGRDEIRANLYACNVKKFRDTRATEEYSKVEGDMAWCLATVTFNEYDADGVIKAKRSAKRLIIFTRKPGAEWKMQFIIVHE
jgi:uncharacterized protein (TIGR02246 family)